MTSRPDIPPAERKKGFAYRLDGFTVNKIPRENPARLVELLLPQNIKGKRAQKASQEDAKRIVKKPWIEAQLKHYGISYNPKAVVSEKEALLVKAVSDGLCRTVPESVNELEASLRQLFEPKKRAYEVALNDHEVSEATRVNREFAALDSPSAEAEYSIEMFLKKHFLNEAGQPDKSKTLKPMPLPGFSNRAQMHAAAERIPGLEAHSGGRGDDRTVVIGWDRSAVWRAAGQVDSHCALRLQQVEEAEWNRLMQRHELFISQSRSQDTAAKFSIHETGGTYVINCDEMGSYSSEKSYNNTMRLRIIERDREGWVGIFDFGVITGIMLLDENKERLASRIATLDRKSNYGCEDQDDSSNHTDDGSNGQGTSKKRKAEKVEGPSRSRKRQKHEKANGGTVFLQWRGEETGEGEIQLDDANEHVGQLDFLDNRGLKFEGTAAFGFIGKKIRFQGYKIRNVGGPATRSWNDYSEAAYERARVRRWR